MYIKNCERFPGHGFQVTLRLRLRRSICLCLLVLLINCQKSQMCLRQWQGHLLSCPGQPKNRKNPTKRVTDTLQDFWPDLSRPSRYWSYFPCSDHQYFPLVDHRVPLLLRALRKLMIVRKWMGWTRIPHGPCFEGLTAWQWTDILTSQCGLARTHTPILRPREWENNESKNLSWDCIYCYGLCVVFDTVCKPIKVTLCSTLKQISAHFCPSAVILKKQNEKLLFEIHQYILACILLLQNG